MENRCSRIEYSLRSSAQLGLEVLRRAQQRQVHWSVGGPSSGTTVGAVSSALRDELVGQAAEGQMNFDEAFASILQFMAHSTKQCQRYYDSMPASSRSNWEENHIRRYHNDDIAPSVSRQPQYFNSKPASSRSKWEENHIRQYQMDKIPPSVSRQPIDCTEEIHIEVAPGSYKVTATSKQSARQQTHVINLRPGQTIDLTFTT
eukprot:gi/632941227/ref/XP_007885750.1/ PREDICTED: A-kinase-interacting protein 1-like isoform X3 [Callorhinchus milii]